jgi:hypothetical protein
VLGVSRLQRSRRDYFGFARLAFRSQAASRAAPARRSASGVR